MIQRSEVVSIGRLYKTHGISGELAFEGTSHYREEGTSPYWIVDVEGILVPFFLESIRYKSDQTAFVCFQGITSEKQAEELVGCEVFYPVTYLPENSSDKNSMPLLIGYTVVDQTLGELGELVAIDDSTLNVLMIVESKDRQWLIPLVDELVTAIDDSGRFIRVSLPDGWLDL